MHSIRASLILGGATFYGRPFKCWKKGGHGSIDFRHAIEQSCDVYFYTVANPALPAETPTAAGDAAASAPPAATPAPGAPAPAAAAPVPRVMTRLGVLRDGKPAFASRMIVIERKAPKKTGP